RRATTLGPAQGTRGHRQDDSAPVPRRHPEREPHPNRHGSGEPDEAETDARLRVRLEVLRPQTAAGGEGGRDAVRVNWRGVFPAVTTQFKADQSLDVEATGRHLEKLLAAGVHGVIMLGTVGENCSLEPAEKLAVLSATVELVRGRVPVLTG